MAAQASDLSQTMKLHIHTDSNGNELFTALTKQYANACNEISQYVFDNDCVMNFMDLQTALYGHIRETYGLKAQFTISTFKTVTARYKTVDAQMKQHPAKYKDDAASTKDRPVYISVNRDISWLQHPIHFSRPQADFVRGRDYSFVNGDNGTKLLSLNTLDKTICNGPQDL